MAVVFSAGGDDGRRSPELPAQKRTLRLRQRAIVDAMPCPNGLGRESNPVSGDEQPVLSWLLNEHAIAIFWTTNEV
jgi:hypothetical protein